MVACEWNRDSVEALRRNLRLNGVEQRCQVRDPRASAVTSLLRGDAPPRQRTDSVPQTAPVPPTSLRSHPLAFAMLPGGDCQCLALSSPVPYGSWGAGGGGGGRALGGAGGADSRVPGPYDGGPRVSHGSGPRRHNSGSVRLMNPPPPAPPPSRPSPPLPLRLSKGAVGLYAVATRTV